MTNQEKSENESLGDVQQVMDDGPDNQEHAESKSATAAELTPEEKEVVASLKKLGLEYRSHEPSLILFSRPDDGTFRPEGAIFRDRTAELARQLDDGLVNHPTKLGFAIPSRGFAETVIRDSRWPRPAISNVYIKSQAEIFPAFRTGRVLKQVHSPKRHGFTSLTRRAVLA